MSKSGNSGTTKTGGRGPSNHPGQGGNWPSTTGNPSGRDRGNAPPEKKISQLVYIIDKASR